MFFPIFMNYKEVDLIIYRDFSIIKTAVNDQNTT